MPNKYKVGDRIRVRDDFDPTLFYGGHQTFPSMTMFLRSKRIHVVREAFDNGSLRLEGEDRYYIDLGRVPVTFYYSDQIFVPAPPYTDPLMDAQKEPITRATPEQSPKRPTIRETLLSLLKEKRVGDMFFIDDLVAPVTEIRGIGVMGETISRELRLWNEKAAKGEEFLNKKDIQNRWIFRFDIIGKGTRRIRMSKEVRL